MYIKKVKYKGTKTGCWECTSHAPAGKGYPRMQRNKKGLHVDAYIWRKYNGDIPEGLSVLHKCDNRLCINPKHLYLGTIAENGRDMAVRERSGQLKISNADVLVIRELEGIVPQVVLAFQYGVSPHHITDICKRRKRQHI